MAKYLFYIKQYGVIKCCLMAVDSICHHIIRFLRKIFYTWNGDKVGLKEAILWSKDLDEYLRYSKVLNEILQITSQENRKFSIVDVGAGGEGISKFLKYSGDYAKFDIVLADTDPQSMCKVKHIKTVVITGEQLPFKNEQFDFVISVDTLEHIPKDKREKFLLELKRVSRKIVLINFVMHDPQRNYLGRDGDLKFNQWYLEYFKKEQKWVTEHLKIEPPMCWEIEKVFENAVITGTQNIDIWYKRITKQSKPIAGFLAGFFYMNKWKEKENQPPFHGCLVKWNKEKISSK
jgi:ubiquinone/menaquinone biosynthesis C-methylase UbiE